MFKPVHLPNRGDFLTCSIKLELQREREKERESGDERGEERATMGRLYDTSTFAGAL